MSQLKTNYHVHTTFCRHSNLSPEGVIEKSLKLGLDTIGFSEHIRYENENTKDAWRVGTEKEEKEYIKTINVLKEKYKDKIEILCGFEADIFHPETKKPMYDWSASRLELEGVDFLILGHHTYWSFDKNKSDEYNLKQADWYLNMLKEALKTKAFKYIAHPDIYFQDFDNEWNNVTKYISNGLIELAVKNNIPLAININGFIWKNHINKNFWKLAGTNGAKAIIELDAHGKEPFDHEEIKRGYDLAKEVGITVIERI